MNVVNTGGFEPAEEVCSNIYRSRDFDKYASKVFLPGVDQDECYDALFSYLTQRLTVRDGHLVLSPNENVNLVHSNICTFDAGRLVLFRVRADGVVSDYVKKPSLTRFVFAIDNLQRSLVLLLCYKKKTDASAIPEQSLQNAINSYLAEPVSFPSQADEQEDKSAFIDSISSILRIESLEKIQSLFDAVSRDGLDMVAQKISFAETYSQEDIDALLQENFELSDVNKDLQEEVSILKERLLSESKTTSDQSEPEKGHVREVNQDGQCSEIRDSSQSMVKLKMADRFALNRMVKDLFSLSDSIKGYFSTRLYDHFMSSKGARVNIDTFEKLLVKSDRVLGLLYGSYIYMEMYREHTRSMSKLFNSYRYDVSNKHLEVLGAELEHVLNRKKSYVPTPQNFVEVTHDLHDLLQTIYEELKTTETHKSLLLSHTPSSKGQWLIPKSEIRNILEAQVLEAIRHPTEESAERLFSISYLASVPGKVKLFSNSFWDRIQTVILRYSSKSDQGHMIGIPKSSWQHLKDSFDLRCVFSDEELDNIERSVHESNIIVTEGELLQIIEKVIKDVKFVSSTDDIDLYSNDVSIAVQYLLDMIAHSYAYPMIMISFSLRTSFMK